MFHHYRKCRAHSMNEAVTEALRSLYAGRRQQLFTYALSITHDRESAEDVIHQVFQRLLKKGALPQNLLPYVFRSVRNAALDDLRRTRVRASSLFDETEMGDSFPSPAGGALLASELEEALNAVSCDEREVIVLRIYNALTFQEIADLRDLPLSTVTSWYRRGLETVKAKLGKETR